MFQWNGKLAILQHLKKIKKYDGLIVWNRKLGCDHCTKVDSLNKKGLHVSVEWKACNITASEKNKEI